MYILIGLLIIAAGAFCQSSSYVPINKIKRWSWESYWMVQGVFAWLVLPLLGASIAIPEGHSLAELLGRDWHATWMTMFYGCLWGVGGLTFGLSMRYLGVALGQSISLGTCAALGTLLAPIFTGNAHELTMPVIIGVAVTLAGITVIGIAGHLKTSENSQQGAQQQSVKEFDFTKGITVALLAGFMSACFNIGLAQGQSLTFEGVNPMFQSLPATLMVTTGGFIVNAAYCFFQNSKNHTWSDYGQPHVLTNNLLFCILAGALWYSQFFGLALGKGFLTESPALTTFAFSILMALNVVFSNVWGIILKEWRGASTRTISVLVVGLAILILSSFLPQLL